MPVTVQIPETAEFQEVLFPSLEVVRGILRVGNYIYIIGGLFGPGWIVQADKSNLSSYTILTFPNDDKHLIPIDLCHAPSTGHIYIIFRNVDVPANEPQNFQLTIGRVTTAVPFSILSDFVDVHGTYLPQAGSVTTDDTFLYVTVSQPPNMLRYRLTDANLTVTSLASFTFPGCIRYSDNKLFLTGLTLPETQWVMRMSTLLSVEQSTTIGAPGGLVLEGNFGVSTSHLWMGNFRTDGILKKILKTDLTNMADVATGQLSRGVSVDNDGTNIWELFQNGRAARVNPSTSAVSLYTVNTNQDFHREITGDGTFVFAASSTTV